MLFARAILSGIAGAAFGWAACAMIGLSTAAAVGMSDGDGRAVVFAVMTVGPIGGALGLCIGTVLVFNRMRHATFGGVAWRSLVAMLIVLLLGAGGLRVGRLANWDISASQASIVSVTDPAKQPAR